MTDPGQHWASRYLRSSAVWSFPGKGHDRVLVQENFAGVADGATPLGPEWGDPGPFAQAALDGLARTDPTVHGVAGAFRDAIRQVESATSVHAEATCAVAAAWFDATTVNVGVLGDCLAAVVQVDGTNVLYTDRSVSRLDAEALAVAAPDRLDLLRRHRRAANTPEGYWIFGTDPQAAEHVSSGRHPLSEVVAIFLASDGVLREPRMRAWVESSAEAPLPLDLLEDLATSVATRVTSEGPVDAVDDEAAVLLLIGDGVQERAAGAG
jgi:hypothetical protein